MARPFTEDDQRRLRELHANGLSLTRISKEMRRASSTIHLWSTRLGLSYDRSATATAVKAKVIDAAARRAAFAEACIDDAERLRTRMWTPFRQVQYVGRDGDRVEDVLDEPPPAEQYTYMRAAALAADKHMKLIDFDKGEDGQRLSKVDAFLNLMVGGSEQDG
jgi:hypothetical protein